MKDWFWTNCNTYVKLVDTVNPSNFEKRFDEVFSEKIAEYIIDNNLKINGYNHYREFCLSNQY